MKKDLTSRMGSSDRSPTMRRASLFNPWFDDVFEPARLFDDFFPREMYQSDSRFLAPAIDIDETSDAYIVSADLPGVKKEDISIECTGNQLTLSAERKYESEENRRSDRRERFYGSYQRSFTLPAGADAENVEASYEGGVLTIHIPKGEQAKARKITIGESKNQNSGRIGKQ